MRKLREAKNPVRGIVDRDERQGTNEGIVFLPNRRTLENLVLDPLPLGLLLLREGFIKSDEMIGEDLINSRLRPEHAQRICDYVASKMLLEEDSRDHAIIRYAGNFEISVPSIILELSKDDLAERMLRAFPMLRRFSTGQLMRKVIELAIRDRPDFAPQDVLTLFTELIAA